MQGASFGPASPIRRTSGGTYSVVSNRPGSTGPSRPTIPMRQLASGSTVLRLPAPAPHATTFGTVTPIPPVSPGRRQFYPGTMTPAPPVGLRPTQLFGFYPGATTPAPAASDSMAFEAMDTNKDGVVSRAEWAQAAQAWSPASVSTAVPMSPASRTKFFPSPPPMHSFVAQVAPLQRPTSVSEVPKVQVIDRFVDKTYVQVQHVQKVNEVIIKKEVPIKQDLVTTVEVPKIVERIFTVPVHQVVEVPQVIEVQEIETVGTLFVVQNDVPVEDRQPLPVVERIIERPIVATQIVEHEVNEYVIEEVPTVIQDHKIEEREQIVYVDRPTQVAGETIRVPKYTVNSVKQVVEVPRVEIQDRHISVATFEMESTQVPVHPRARGFTHVLKVAIVAAQGLRDADWLPGGGNSDPYCICILRKAHGERTEKFRTKVCNNTADPFWNHAMETISDYQLGDVLEFEVWDADMLKTDDLLGRVELSSAYFLPNGFAGHLELSETGQRSRATLQVCVQGQAVSAPSGYDGRAGLKPAPMVG